MSRWLCGSWSLGVFLLTACASDGALAPLVSLDPENFDLRCDPCEDVYRFTNGGWLERNPIPADRGSWGTFGELSTRNELLLRQIVEDLAATPQAPGSTAQKLGDAWCSCMDELRAAAEGGQALQPFLARLTALESGADVWREVALLHADGFSPLFHLYSDQDAGDATHMLLQWRQGGLGLPDRDDYTKTDEASVALRAAYVAHVTRMLVLVGQDEASAAADAQTILALETQLAAASLGRVEQRDPHAIYHKLPVPEAAAASGLDLPLLLATVGALDVGQVNVQQPGYFTELSRLLDQVPPSTWAAYLRAHVARSLAPALSPEFVDEDFAWQGRVLAGNPEQQPRWRRCLQFVDGALGQALGEQFVARAFSPEAKRRADAMVADLRATFRERLEALDWMSAETKARALAKLDAFRVKIGYPDRWRDYSALRMDRGSHAANLLRANVFELDRQLGMAGQPVDRDDWLMGPHEVNAYYNPGLNEIVFPAGILQPPFFGEHQDDASNYGSMGAVIGHEITHGFDDEGSQYDGDGNLSNWWTPEDRAEFERRADVVRRQYDAYEALPGLHVNGSLTLGENLADLGGITIAYHAWLRSQQGKLPAQEIDGLSGPQRVFLAWAQGWRGSYRPEALRVRVTTNPHSPGNFRALGPLSNLPEFFEAFGCEPGDAMVREELARVW